MLSFFPQDVLDEILDLIESVSVGFSTTLKDTTFSLLQMKVTNFDFVLVKQPFEWQYFITIM